MTNIYFVRHAQTDHSFADAALRPLTEEGIRDTLRVVEAMRDIHLDYAISSPYKRSYDTIKQAASGHRQRNTVPLESHSWFWHNYCAVSDVRLTA